MTPEEIIAADLTQYSYADVKAVGERFRSVIRGVEIDLANSRQAEKKLFERWADGWSMN